jgi:hypothetical protein
MAGRPEPLPPETRTIGQLVAETIRLYRDHFWAALALGIAPALLFVASVEWKSHLALTILALVSALVNSAVYVAACVVALDVRPERRVLLTAFLVGLVVWLPAFFIPLIWFAAVGLAVPAAVAERVDYAEALRRGFRLFRADVVHAFFGVLALVAVTFLTGAVLFVLLRAGSQQGIRVAAGLASLVLSPVLYLGAALLYVDQRARLDRVAAPEAKGGSDADLHPALESDRPGGADVEVEPRPAAGGES